MIITIHYCYIRLLLLYIVHLVNVVVHFILFYFGSTVLENWIFRDRVKHEFHAQTRYFHAWAQTNVFSVPFGLHWAHTNFDTTNTVRGIEALKTIFWRASWHSGDDRNISLDYLKNYQQRRKYTIFQVDWRYGHPTTHGMDTTYTH